MRTIAFFFLIGLSCVFFTPSIAAPNPWCFGVFPVDITDCKSPLLTELHNKTEALYLQALSQAKGAKQRTLLEEHNAWLISRGAKCGVPVIEWVTDEAVRRARPCLASVYQARITRLEQLLTPSARPPTTVGMGDARDSNGKVAGIPKDDPELPINGHVADKVIACYKAGNATVADMYACAGVWITPRILTLCFLEASCPAIPDKIDSRLVVDAALGGPGKLDTKLSIDMSNVLSIPDRKIIEECKGAGADPASTCVVPKMPPASLRPLMACAALTDEKEKALCLAKGAPAEFSSLVQCMTTKGGGAGALTECTPNPAWTKVQDVQKCITDTSGNAKLDCLLAGADPTQKALATCLSGSSDRAALALDCLSKSNPQMAEKIAVATCVAKAVGVEAATSCVAKLAGGDGAKIAACATGEKDKMVSCLLGDKPEYKAAAQVVACVQGGRDATSLVANCSDFLIKDQKTRAVLACATQAGSDSSKLIGCAASSVLPPEVAHYASCAATSQGAATSFALCAAGPQMNEEWRIAAECAVDTGGNPLGFAGCTAGRLTLKELTQCFTGGSCFGPNNTIVKTFRDAFNDLLHGPGENNEIVVAFKRLGELSGGPNSVINNPTQIFGGDNSIFKTPGQILGGEHAAVREFLEKPLGGDKSVPNVILGGPCSFVRNPFGGGC